MNGTGETNEELLLDANQSTCLTESTIVYRFYVHRKFVMFHQFTAQVTFKTSETACNSTGFKVSYQDKGLAALGCTVGRTCEITDELYAANQLNCTLRCPCTTVECYLLVVKIMRDQDAVCEVSIEP